MHKQLRQTSLRKVTSSISSSWCDEASVLAAEGFQPTVPASSGTLTQKMMKYQGSLDHRRHPVKDRMVKCGSTTNNNIGDKSPRTVIPQEEVEEPDWDEGAVNVSLSTNHSIVSLEDEQDWYDPIHTTRQMKAGIRVKKARSGTIQPNNVSSLRGRDDQHIAFVINQKDKMEPVSEALPCQEDDIQPFNSVVRISTPRTNNSLFEDDSPYKQLPKQSSPTNSSPLLATQVLDFLGMKLSSEKTTLEMDDAKKDHNQNNNGKRKTELAKAEEKTISPGHYNNDKDEFTSLGELSRAPTDLLGSLTSFDLARLEILDASTRKPGNGSREASSCARNSSFANARVPRLPRSEQDPLVQGRQFKSFSISKTDDKPALLNTRLEDDDWFPIKEEEDLLLSPTNRSLSSVPTSHQQPGKGSNSDSQWSRHRLSQRIGQQRSPMSVGDAISLGDGSLISNAFQADPSNTYSIPWLGWSNRPQLKENKIDTDDTSFNASRSVESSIERNKSMSDSSAFQNDPTNSEFGYTFDDNTMASTIESTMSVESYRLVDYLKPSFLCRGAAFS